MRSSRLRPAWLLRDLGQDTLRFRACRPPTGREEPGDAWAVHSGNLPNRSTVKGASGVSLLEVLIAMALVSVLLLGVAGYGAVAVKGTAFGKDLTVAVTLAQASMETVRRVGYQSTISRPVVQNEPYGTIRDFPAFRRSVRIEPHSPMPGLQTVTVTVEWAKGGHSTSLFTILGP